MNIDVSNKIVVITGASKGIGKELAISFAKEGAIVVMNYYHSKELANEVYSEIKTISPRSLLVRADVTNPRDVSSMYHEIIKQLGHIDVLINNAGVCDDNFIQMMPIEQWQKVIDVNLTGVFLCCREFSKIMMRQNKGKILNIASLKGQEGSSGQVNYSASKAGVIGFTKALAKELGEYQIAVNAICPGFIVTDLNRHNIDKQRIAQNKSILKKMASLDDLVNFILFMSSDCMQGVSGRVFNIDSRLN